MIIMIWKTCFLGVFAQFVLLKRAGKFWKTCMFFKILEDFFVILVKR